MDLNEKFPGKRALVTGAASGLGLEICKYLAGRGWRLLVADINADRLGQTETSLQSLGAETLSMVMDVTEYKALENAAETILEAWGGVDLVFNNAGIATAGTIDELTLEDWQRTIDIDLWSVIYGCKVFTPILKKQGGGHIINTASSAGTLAAPEMAAYNVAKAGVVSLSETLNSELSRHNIGVTVVCPTVFATSLGDSIGTDRAMEKALLKQLEASRVTAKDIVDDVIAAIERDRLYVMTQSDARWGWRLKRFSPELFASFIGYCYRKRKWIFTD